MHAVRLFFTKTGVAKYISHLDLVRCMTRALKRSKLPVWYTEGFHPHIYITFPLPLSLGIEGRYETADIRLLEIPDYQMVQQQLNACLPPDIQVVKAAEPQKKPDVIAFAEYQICFETEQPKRLVAAFEQALAGEELLGTKTVKSKGRKVEKQINLMDLIQKVSFTEKENKVTVQAILVSGIQKNLNPTLLLQALCQQSGEEIKRAAITRTQVFTEDFQLFT